MSEPRDLAGLLILGLLARESSMSPTVHNSTIRAALSEHGIAIGDDQLCARIDEIVRAYPALGLTWDDRHKDRLRAIPGLHWWGRSDAYLGITRCFPEQLARLFADVAREALEHHTVKPRLLVDAGVTVFHCLLHRHCHLADNASEILTNNLFVSQALNSLKVRLLSGEWDLRTGALVNCTDKPARLEQLLSARHRRPDVAVLSFDSIGRSTCQPSKATKHKELAFYMQHVQESQLKLAAFGATKRAIFILLEAAEIGRTPVADGPSCAMSYLVGLQNKTQHAARDIYIISDLKNPLAGQQAVIEQLSDKRLRDHRIWFISPDVDTRRPP